MTCTVEVHESHFRAGKEHRYGCLELLLVWVWIKNWHPLKWLASMSLELGRKLRSVWPIIFDGDSDLDWRLFALWMVQSHQPTGVDGSSNIYTWFMLILQFGVNSFTTEELQPGSQEDPRVEEPKWRCSANGQRTYRNQQWGVIAVFTF